MQMNPYPFQSVIPMYYPYPNINPYYYPMPQATKKPRKPPLTHWSPGKNTRGQKIELKDYGPEPLAIDIEKATKQNMAFRMALWTGPHLQVTLMSIPVRGEIGLEMHPNVDQFIRIEEGEGMTSMGDTKEDLTFNQRVEDDDVIIIPAGKWHNLVNTGNEPLKLYSIYSSPQHPKGTVQKTKAEAEEMEQSRNSYPKNKFYL